MLAAGFASATLIEASRDGRIVTALVLCAAAVCAWAAVWHPSLFPALAISYLPYNLSYPLQLSSFSGLNGGNLVLAAGVLALVVSRVRRPGRRLLIGFEYLVLLFLLIGAMGAVRGVASEGQVDLVELVIRYRDWAGPMLLFLIARQVTEDRRDAEAFLSVLAWGLFLIACLTWLQGIDLSGRRSIEASRVGGILRQPNSMGAFLAYYAAPMLAVAVSAGPRLRRAAALGVFLVAARATIFTYSRGAMLALGTGSAVVFGFVNPLGLGVVGGAVWTVDSFPDLMPSAIAARFRQTTRGDTEIYEDRIEADLDRSSAQRLNLWRGALEMVSRQPLTGFGLGRFGQVVERYTPQELGPNDPRDAHNAYLKIAAELGLPGLASLAAILLWIGGAAIASRLSGAHKSERMVGLACAGSLGAVIVSCMFGSRFADEALVGGFWLLAGLLLGLRALPPGPPDDAVESPDEEGY